MAHSFAMTTNLRRSAIPAVLAALLVAGCGNANPTPPAPSPSIAPGVTASPGATSTPEAPASPAAAACDPATIGSPVPAGADTNDPNASLYAEIEGQVSDLRGIVATKPVERGVFDKAGLCAYIVQSFRADNPEALVTGTENLYKSLLLMPGDASLEDLYIELLTSQVAGLYDDKSKKMYVVSSTGEIGPAEEITYAHEYTHALQDQKFVLKDVMGDATDQSDRSLARSALVEGDATLLMSLWAQQHLTLAELGQVANAADPASQAILAKMPAILKDPLLFPYTGGLQFNLVAFQGGGYGAVDKLYANLPASTEQILHPEKFASDELPVKVSFPDGFPASLGTGWSVGLEDTLGEFQLEILLRDAAGASGSSAAAAGWGGDRVAYLQGPDGANATVIDTAWDTDADATEFSTALEGYPAKLQAAGRVGAVLMPAPDRVVVISASDETTLGHIANVLGLAG